MKNGVLDLYNLFYQKLNLDANIKAYIKHVMIIKPCWNNAL